MIFSGSLARLSTKLFENTHVLPSSRAKEIVARLSPLLHVYVPFDKHDMLVGEHTTKRGKQERVENRREQGDSACKEENKNYAWDTYLHAPLCTLFYPVSMNFCSIGREDGSFLRNFVARNVIFFFFFSSFGELTSRKLHVVRTIEEI